MDARTYHYCYSSHGLPQDITALVSTQGSAYLRMVMPLPPTFRRLVTGDALTIGRHRFEVMSGDGHAAEQLMLYCPTKGIFVAADQDHSEDLAEYKRVGGIRRGTLSASISAR